MGSLQLLGGIRNLLVVRCVGDGVFAALRSILLHHLTLHVEDYFAAHLICDDLGWWNRDTIEEHGQVISVKAVEVLTLCRLHSIDGATRRVRDGDHLYSCVTVLDLAYVLGRGVGCSARQFGFDSIQVAERQYDASLGPLFMFLCLPNGFQDVLEADCRAHVAVDHAFKSFELLSRLQAEL